jgi:hypothetical protein
MIDVFRVVGAILGSIALGGGIVAAIVKVAADWISKRTLDHYNNKHAKELEDLKAGYSEALAKTSHELEKAERRFYLYSQSQFELYNSLWMQLVNTNVLPMNYGWMRILKDYLRLPTRLVKRNMSLR